MVVVMLPISMPLSARTFPRSTPNRSLTISLTNPQSLSSMPLTPSLVTTFPSLESPEKSFLTKAEMSSQKVAISPVANPISPSLPICFNRNLPTAGNSVLKIPLNIVVPVEKRTPSIFLSQPPAFLACSLALESPSHFDSAFLASIFFSIRSLASLFPK